MQLVLYPDLRLRNTCKPVESFTENIRGILNEMSRHMVEWGGIGLAAPQCGLALAMFVAEVPGKKVMAFVNPEIECETGQKATFDEGCLSIPGVHVPVERPASVLIRAQDGFGKRFEIRCSGILAVCVQHEVDHLSGLNMLDRTSAVEKRRAVQKLFSDKLRRG